MVFPALLHDEPADILHHSRQLVGADVGVGVDEYRRRRAEADEVMEHLADVAALGGAGVELAVGKCAGAALTVAVVGIGVDLAAEVDRSHVGLAGVDILSALENHRAQAEGDQLQRGEHSGRAGPDNQHRVGSMDVAVLREAVRLIVVLGRVRLVAVAPDRLLAGVDRTLLQHPLQAAGLGFNFPETRFARQRADNLEFFHARSRPFVRRGRRRAVCALRPDSGSSRRWRSSRRCRW